MKQQDLESRFECLFVLTLEILLNPRRKKKAKITNHRRSITHEFFLVDFVTVHIRMQK